MVTSLRFLRVRADGRKSQKKQMAQKPNLRVPQFHSLLTPTLPSFLLIACCVKSWLEFIPHSMVGFPYPTVESEGDRLSKENALKQFLGRYTYCLSGLQYYFRYLTHLFLECLRRRTISIDFPLRSTLNCFLLCLICEHLSFVFCSFVAHI